MSTLLQEPSVQSVPQDTDSTAYKVLKLMRSCIRATDKHSKFLQSSYGITTPQQLCLLTLQRSGIASISELATSVQLSNSTVVGIIDRLEKQGMVYRERHSSDRRVVNVKITEKGQILADNSPPPIQRRLVEGLNNLPEGEQAEIVHSLEKIVSLLGIVDIDAAPILQPGHEIQLKNSDNLYIDCSENAVKEGQKDSIAQFENFYIRLAEWEDMETIANFIRSTAEWYSAICNKEDMTEHNVDENWKQVNFRRREFFISYANNEPVGTISLQHFGNYGYLGYIYLDKKHVGKRYGHILMSFIEQVAKDRGLEGLVLIAHPKATWATKAYEKFGFKEILTDKKSILEWQDGVFEPYYEEGFHLFQYQF